MNTHIFLSYFEVEAYSYLDHLEKFHLKNSLQLLLDFYFFHLYKSITQFI